MQESVAYINWGRNVVECPVQGCHDAREVQPGQDHEACVQGHRFRVVWAPDAAQVMSALLKRPDERNRNWFPKNHPRAVESGQPHGQTIRELDEEAKALANPLRAEAITDQADLRALLREHGYAVADDGVTLRRL